MRQVHAAVDARLRLLGASVQPGSAALGIQCEVATMAQLDNSVVPKWNEEPSTLDAFEERVILYVLGTKKEERYFCGPRLLAQMDP